MKSVRVGAIFHLRTFRPQTGNRERLVELLRLHYGFGQNRAEREIDTVLADFAERLRRAMAA